MIKPVKGFSKLTKEEKVSWVVSSFFKDNPDAESVIKRYWNDDDALQQLHDEFIENTISNYYLPLGIAPNFLINGKLCVIPMAIEESSVVAAASKAAKFWLDRGGFRAEVISTTKIGQVHFMYTGDKSKLNDFFSGVKSTLISDSKSITKNMEKRGGGIKSIELVDKTSVLDNYYQLHCKFETLDAMGANLLIPV